MSGILYVVATPIGNLEDITYRAVRVLTECSRVACEDTRHTRRLMDRYSISTPLVSYHEHNERERTADIMSWLSAGEDIALVSDAGTPLISDPGYRIVEAAVGAGVRVVPLPGPAAFLTALSASGLATDSFYYGGFLPAKSGQRRRTLEQAASLDCVLLFYEAPHRLIEALEDCATVFADRRVIVARELTKMHEEFARGTAAELMTNFSARPSVKGEIVLMIDKPGAAVQATGSVREVFDGYVRTGMSKMDAMKATARHCGVSKRDVWAEVERS
jgi:16S rRNA (cytidine1402-2'-O)-methyltransferase